MITIPLINWQPIANMPEDRKDGRSILITDGDGLHVVVHWDESMSQHCAKRLRASAGGIRRI